MKYYNKIDRDSFFDSVNHLNPNKYVISEGEVRKLSNSIKFPSRWAYGVLGDPQAGSIKKTDKGHIVFSFEVPFINPNPSSYEYYYTSYIFKSPDDWYYLLVRFKLYSKIEDNTFTKDELYFKCDQVEGIIDLIDDMVYSMYKNGRFDIH